jgi:hypothetical protein
VKKLGLVFKFDFKFPVGGSVPAVLLESLSFASNSKRQGKNIFYQAIKSKWTCCFKTEIHNYSFDARKKIWNENVQRQFCQESSDLPFAVPGNVKLKLPINFIWRGVHEILFISSGAQRSFGLPFILRTLSSSEKVRLHLQYFLINDCILLCRGVNVRTSGSEFVQSCVNLVQRLRKGNVKTVAINDIYSKKEIIKLVWREF